MSILGDLHKKDNMYIKIKNTIINLNIVQLVRYKYAFVQDKKGQGFLEPGYAHILIIERHAEEKLILYYDNKDDAIFDLEKISKHLNVPN